MDQLSKEKCQIYTSHNFSRLRSVNLSLVKLQILFLIVACEVEKNLLDDQIEIQYKLILSYSHYCVCFKWWVSEEHSLKFRVVLSTELMS